MGRTRQAGAITVSLVALLVVFSAVVGDVSAQPAPPGAGGAPPDPTFFLGDVNCDGSVNSIDAAFLLQLEAGLIDSLPCPDNADMNNDGATSSLDAGLILQHTAGLIRSPVRFSLNVHRPEGLCDDPEKPTTCDIPVGTEFGLSASLNRPPLEGYVGAQTELFYGELRYNPTTFADEEMIWPDSAFTVRSRFDGEPPTGTEGSVRHGGLTAATPPLRISAYRGSLTEIGMTCSTQPQAFVLALLPFVGENTFGSGVLLPAPDGGPGPPAQTKTVGQLDLDLDLSGTIEPEEEQVDVAATLQINCVAVAAPTP